MKELQCLYLHCNSNETWRERELCHLLGIYDVYAPKCVTERCSIWLLFHKSSVLKTENRFFFTPHTHTHWRCSLTHFELWVWNTTNAEIFGSGEPLLFDQHWLINDLFSCWRKLGQEWAEREHAMCCILNRTLKKYRIFDNIAQPDRTKQPKEMSASLWRQWHSESFLQLHSMCLGCFLLCWGFASATLNKSPLLGQPFKCGLVSIFTLTNKVFTQVGHLDVTDVLVLLGLQG